MSESEEIVNNEKKVTALIREFLQKFQNEKVVEIIDYEYDDKIVEAGRNFASIVSRLRIEYVDKIGKKSAKSFIIKIPFLSSRYDRLQKTGIYSREVFVFNNLLPKIRELYPKHEEYFTAFCYHTTDTEALFLEDLGETGYIPRSKTDELDLEHCRIMIKTLARFHATSFKYLQTDEGKNLKLDIEMDPAIWQIIGDRCDLAIALISTFKHTKSATTQKLKKYKNERFVDNHRKALKLSANRRNVIIHGDLSSANILFAYDDKKQVCNCKMIDWQFCLINTPMMDLLTLFVTSLRFEIFENFKNDLLDSYLKEFNRILDELKCDQIYTAEELNDDFKATEFYIIHLIIYILPIFCNLFMNSKDVNDNGCTSLYETIALKWLHYVESQDILQ